MKNFALFDYINVHTHLPEGKMNVLEIQNLYFNQPKTALHTPISAGLHPWYLEAFSPESASIWMNDLILNPALMAIGESGLDKVTSTDWDLQLRAFEFSIEWAIAHRKPLIVHCVRAYQECLQILKVYQSNLPPIVFHGFNKNIETARPILDAGYYLSFGEALFQARSHAGSVLSWMPANRFLLETDHAPISIQSVYDRAADLRGLSMAALRTQVAANAEQVFIFS